MELFLIHDGKTGEFTVSEYRPYYPAWCVTCWWTHTVKVWFYRKNKQLSTADARDLRNAAFRRALEIIRSHDLSEIYQGFPRKRATPYRVRAAQKSDISKPKSVDDIPY